MLHIKWLIHFKKSLQAETLEWFEIRTNIELFHHRTVQSQMFCDEKLVSKFVWKLLLKNEIANWYNF